jgi:hypothetical protein
VTGTPRKKKAEERRVRGVNVPESSALGEEESEPAKLLISPRLVRASPPECRLVEVVLHRRDDVVEHF